MKKTITAIINSYSEVFFLQGLLPGTLLFAIGLLNPNSAGAGLIAILSAYLFAQFIHFKEDFLSSGFYTYNPLLVGLAIGFLFKLSSLTIFFIITASILTFIITVVLANIFSTYLRLQILSIPFIIVSSLVYLAAAKYSNLYVNNLYVSSSYYSLPFLPDTVAGFFKAMGAIIFLPNPLAGLCLTLMLLLTSRILTILAIVGFITGVTIQGIFTGSLTGAINDIGSFNYILISMAIGGITLIPSIQSYILALIGVALATTLSSAVNVFWAQYGIPIFTLPFTIITLSFTYVLGLVNHNLRPLIYKATPEETLDHYITNKDRFHSTPISINLPFGDTWTVWQGFDGKWTHQGLWKHGYDFVITDENQSTYAYDGSLPEHYYCYKKEILSPVRGRVIKAISNFPDNPIGAVDTINNWGNHIIIHDTQNVFIEISHFCQHGITVKEGDWVEPGTLIGYCGNSGYSPQPHIHIQVQALAPIGSPTIPYTFNSYIENQHYIAQGLPKESTKLSPAYPHPYYEQLTTFILDDTYTYDVYKKDKKIKQITLTVKMAPDSTFYLESDTAKLYIGKLHGTHYAYHMEGNDSILKLFYLALPKLPLHFSPGLTWTDTISNTLFLDTFRKIPATLCNALIPGIIKTKSSMRFLSQNEIEGSITNKWSKKSLKTYIKLDPAQHITKLCCGEIECTLVEKGQLT